ncbi:MAG: FeoA family protein, partial [Bacteroidota bacterium]
STTDAPVVLVGVKSHEEDFLHYLDEQGLGIGTELVVESRMSYDDSLRVTSSDGSSLVLSAKVSNHIYVKTN